MNLLPLSDGKILVRLARNAIENHFSGKSTLKEDKFSEKRGVFVTLNENGKLRGCIGFPEPVYPLNKAIIDSARAAAFRDPRFEPVTEEELDKITIDISVLTNPELLEIEAPEEYLAKIKIGRDGLIIKSLYHSGLLLPQVFTDYQCTAQKALEMTCEKAGLDKDSWQEPESKIYSFQAQIFKEETPNGNVVEEKISSES